jgi:ABC-type polysaccharide/polyol phosphate transport system ATPase subunit
VSDAPETAPAVVVDGVAKRFRLPHERTHTLKERALHPMRKTQYEQLDALRDVSFTVPKGEFFGIVGRNGSGKSTLLKCLAGIYGVDKGSIAVDGRMSTFIELGVGFNPDLAAYDNVVTNAIMLGLTPKEAASRFDSVLAFAELEEFVDLKIKNYSSGMLVRLAFSVAIEAEADVLLIDEVLAVGDAAFQQKCFDVFTRLRDEGRTMILVTHDMTMVERLCDRAMLLERGEIVEMGKTDQVSRRYLELNFDAEKRANPHADTGGKGDGAVTVEAMRTVTADPQTDQDMFHHGDFFVAKARVRFNAPVDDPVFNLVVINDRNQNVLAASNYNHPEGAGHFEAGEVVEVDIGFHNYLAPGRYELSMVVYRGRMSFEILDVAERIASILVVNPSPNGALVDVPFERASAPSSRRRARPRERPRVHPAAHHRAERAIGRHPPVHHPDPPHRGDGVQAALLRLGARLSLAVHAAAAALHGALHRVLAVRQLR